MYDERDFETETYVSNLEDQRDALKARVIELDAENKRLWAVFKACPGCKRMVPGVMYGCSMQHEIDLSGTCGHREEGDCAAEVVRRMVQAETERDALKERVAQADARIEGLKAACDAYKTRLAGVEAGAARLREALEEYEDASSADSLEQRIERGIRADKALSSSAGREVLERVKRLEAVADVAQEFRQVASTIQPGKGIPITALILVERLFAALDALEGGGTADVSDALRPVVRAFARAMEQELKANDHKGGWHDCDPAWLLGRLREETDELAGAVAAGGPDVLAEAADVANYAMMIADRMGALERGEER